MIKADIKLIFNDHAHSFLKNIYFIVERISLNYLSIATHAEF